MLEAAFYYMTQSKLYIWKCRENKIDLQIKSRIKNQDNLINRDTTRLSGNKLRDLAWSLDVLDLNKNIEDK